MLALGALGSRDATSGALSRAGMAIVYNRGALAVHLVDGPGSGTYVTDFPATDLSEDSAVPTQARVRVTYLFHCAVPLANRLICNDPLDIALGPTGAAAVRAATGGSLSLDRLRAIQNQYDVARARESRDQQGWNDLGSEARNYLAAFAAASMLGFGPYPRVKLMMSEAQLPIHYGNYEYGS